MTGLEQVKSIVEGKSRTMVSNQNDLFRDFVKILKKNNVIRNPFLKNCPYNHILISCRHMWHGDRVGHRWSRMTKVIYVTIAAGF
jgi:hypothetical protein